MKLLLLASTVSFLAVSNQKCSSNKSTPVTYKARLETKALCMNYTLRLVEGSMDSSMITPSWTDESTGKSYTNVFGLDNPCNFPPAIRQGDEFYFTLDTTRQKECAVCMAYYPTPPKKLAIKVVTP